MINVPRNIDDMSYRYQRPMITLESQRLGVRLSNIVEVSSAIFLKPKTVMKFLQKKLGCQSKNDILYNKTVSVDDLEDILEQLIEHVICVECRNPEVVIVKQKKKVMLQCQACGNESTVGNEIKKILSNE
jgi:translation initiation factor 5